MKKKKKKDYPICHPSGSKIELGIEEEEGEAM